MLYRSPWRCPFTELGKRTLTLHSTAYTVIGIAPPGFKPGVWRKGVFIASIALLAFLSMATCPVFAQSQEVFIPMRDGVKLATDLYFPSVGGRACLSCSNGLLTTRN